APLYVATPTLLEHFGIKPSQIDPAADVVTSRSDLGGVLLGSGRPRELLHPRFQTVRLPKYSSLPTALITDHAMKTLGLRQVQAGWLIQTSRSLTTSQIDAARRLAGAGGLT